MDLNSFPLTKNAYANVSDLSTNTDDSKKYFATLSNSDLEEVIFQLSIDLKSIEGQFYASRSRYFAGESSEYDKIWYPKMRSVQAIKIVQLMCAEKEFEARVWASRTSIAAEISQEKDGGVDSKFFKRFYKIACQYLDGSTIDMIHAFVVGRHSGQINRAAHRALLPNWDELKSPNLKNTDNF